MRTENMLKTRLLCCQIATILAPLQAIASLNTTVITPDINLILSGDFNKTANKTVFNGDTAYITQLKQQKSKRCYYLGAR